MPDIVDMLQTLPHAVTPGPAGPDIAAADVARGHRALRQRRRHRLAGVAGASVAGVAAIVLAATSALHPAPAGTAGSAGSASPVPAATSPLMTLAARITAGRGSLPGNASLQIIDKLSDGKVGDVVYGVYTDGGALYSGDDRQTLIAAVAKQLNEAYGADREVAVARSAATGDLAAARVRMLELTANNDFFLSPAAREQLWKKNAAVREALYRAKKIPPSQWPTSPPSVQSEINNTLWEDCTDALNWAGGNPEIRAGVLRLLSTIPDVTVARSGTGGQPTLTITAGPAVFGGHGDELLTVNATTGLPVSLVSTTPGAPTATETFQESRVTLADIKAGKF